MEVKLIYPKWIGGKALIEFPKSPIQGQIFRFIDGSKEGWGVNTHVYTGNRWVKMRTLDSAQKMKVQSIGSSIKPIRNGTKKL